MPVKKLKNGRWAVISYTSGKRLKRTYATKRAALNRASTSKRRSQRKRSTGSRRSRKGY